MKISDEAKSIISMLAITSIAVASCMTYPTYGRITFLLGIIVILLILLVPRIYRYFFGRDTVVALTDALKKCPGFHISSVEWDDSHTMAHLTGRYRGELFHFDASTKNALVHIVDAPWAQVAANDPRNIQLIEAINAINCHTVGPRVIITNPTDEGMRHLMTVYTTVLPIRAPHQFIDAVLVDMLNRKPALHENLNIEKPWLTKQHSPIGFKG